MSKPTDNSQIKQQIRDFIARNLLYSEDGFHHADDTSFLKEGIIDSLGVMELVEFIQTSFGVTVEQTEITPENFDSVNLLAAYVQRKPSRTVAAQGASVPGAPEPQPSTMAS